MLRILPHRGNGTTGRRASAARRWRVGLGGMALATAGVLGVTTSAGAATIGYQDFQYPATGATGTGVTDPTGSKPESKLWYHDGRWWSTLFTSAGNLDIYWLNTATQTWTDTGVQVENRAVRADVLSTSSKLYIEAHKFGENAVSTSTGAAKLYRYSYNSTTKIYNLDSGFPATIEPLATETMVIDQDSTGVLWAVWTQATGPTASTTTRQVMISHTVVGDDTTWSAPLELPAETTDVSNDDIASIVAFGGNKIGVMWSDEKAAKMQFSVHSDAAAATVWSAPEVIASGTLMVDDHINLKADAAGDVFAVTKTSLSDKATPVPSDPLVVAHKRDTNGIWTDATVGTVGDSFTRATMELDTSTNTVHVIYTGPAAVGGNGQVGGYIYEKTSSASNLSFPAGMGTPLMEDTASPNLNNNTSTKGTVSASTGLAVLASNQTTRYYWHSWDALNAPLVASFGATPTAGTAPMTVNFADSSSGAPTGWAWTFGDGTTSSLQNPTHVYSTPGSYTVSLTVSRSGATDSTKTSPGLVSVAAASSETDITTSADSYTKSSSTGTNYGTVTTLRTRGSTSPLYRSYLRFNVTGVSAPVTKVVLRLRVTDASKAGGAIHLVTDNTWTETGIKWSNQPALGTQVGSVGVVAANVTVDIPLTGVPSSGIVNLGIDSVSTDSAIFSSKEGTVKPQLVYFTS